MEALDGRNLAARSSMELKEYWVHLDAEGVFEKYPGKYQYQYEYDWRMLILRL